MVMSVPPVVGPEFGLTAETLTGAGAPTVRVKAWLAGGATPFEAAMVMGYVPLAAAVPDSMAVPLALSVKVTPEGRAPVSLIAEAGMPVVVTVNLLNTPGVKVSELALVTDGGMLPATTRLACPLFSSEDPTDVQLAVTQEMPFSATCPKRPVGVGLGTTDQAVPSHDSTRVTSPDVACAHPVAVQLVALRQETPRRVLPAAPLAFGLGVIDQAVPFQDSIKVPSDSPTAVQLVELGHDTS